MARLIKAYIDFRGGLNVDAAPDNLADNELELADNAVLDIRGGISKRAGTKPINTVSYNAPVEKLIEWARKDGSTILLAVIGTTLAKINSDGTKTDIIALDDPNIGYFIFQDKFWFTGKQGGVDKFWQYDGLSVSEVVPNSATDNDLAPIKRCRYFLWHPHSQRIFAAGDYQDKTALYFSEPNDPTYFKNTSKLYPVSGEGPITAIVNFGDAVVAFYQRGVYAWQGLDPKTDAVWKRLPLGYGTLSPKTVVLTPASLTFLGLGGIYQMSPALLDYNIVMVANEQLLKNITENKVTSIIKQIKNLSNTCAVYDAFSEKYLLAYNDENAGRNSKILVYDWVLGSFTRWTGIGDINDFCLCSNGDLLIASNGYILKLREGLDDWDTITGTYKPIEFHIRTKQYNLDYPFHLKKIKKFYLASRQYTDNTTTMDISVIVDYVTKSFNNISLDESLVWGKEWGKIWGWVDYVTKEGRIGLKGKRIQLSIDSKGLSVPITLYGIAFEFKVRKPKGVKIYGQA